MSKKTELNKGNPEQHKADIWVLKTLTNGIGLEVIEEQYPNMFPGCDLEKSMVFSMESFTAISGQSRAAVVGACISKLELAHARAVSSKDIKSQILAASKIDEIHRHYVQEGMKYDEENDNPPWES